LEKLEMREEIELSSVNLRYESYRMKNPGQERRLLASILERGIEEPLEGVTVGEERILLNGFKRYRSARKLGLGTVPYKAVAEDEASGIVRVLRFSNDHSLGILEQARFVDDLRTVHKLSVADIAELLSRSKSWVSMRVGLIAEMGEKVRERIFDGEFPIYSYMYTARQFMRMNGEGTKDVEDFVEAVSGKQLSTRDIESLAHGYFRGGDHIREEIRAGNLSLVLDQIKKLRRNPEGLSELERSVLRNLESVGSYMKRLVARHRDERLRSRTFHAEANLLASGILSRLSAFKKALENLYDRSGNA
jgi:predicted transcriptional regulator